MKILQEALSSLKYRMMISSFLGIITGLLNSMIITLINDPGAHYFSLPAQNWFFIALLSTFILSTASRSLLIAVSQSLVFKLRQSLCRQIMQTDLAQIEKVGKSKIYAVLNQDLNMLSNALMIVPSLLINVTIVLACCVYLDLFSPTFTWVMVSVMIGSVIFFYSYDVALVKAKFERVRERADSLFQSYQGLLEGFKELKLNQSKRHAFTEQNLMAASADMRDSNTTALIVYSIAQNLWDNLFYLLVGSLVFLGLQSGESATVVAKIVVVLLFMMAPLKAIVMILPQLRQSIVSIKKIQSLQMSPEPDAINSPLKVQQVDLDQVTYGYGDFKLAPTSLSLNAGGITFIIGQNGSGKSTLSKLLIGLYQPHSGVMRVNGVVLNQKLIESYRNQICAIFTDFYLFDELKVDLSSTRVQTLINRLQLQGKLTVKEGVIDSKALSDGQRKRVALLYAYLEDRQIYLFDEWACDQDPDYKKVFYQELLPELKSKGKMVVVVSHDDRYFDAADQVVRLSE